MDTPQKNRTLFAINEDTNVAQDTLEALRTALRAVGAPLPQLSVDWTRQEPRITLGSVSLAEAHTLCRHLGVEVVHRRHSRLRKFTEGQEIWDSHRGAFATVLRIDDGALSVEDRAGRHWEARRHQCMPAAEAVAPDAPTGTRPTTVDQDSVQEGDYIWVAGAYRLVEAKRPGTSLGGKVLRLRGHGLWVLTGPSTAHRPVVSAS